MINNYSRARSAITHDQAVEMIDIKGEEILDRAKKYTDIKVDAQAEVYEKSLKHLETLLQNNNEMMRTMMDNISERLDRIDKRMSKSN